MSRRKRSRSEKSLREANRIDEANRVYAVAQLTELKGEISLSNIWSFVKLLTGGGRYPLRVYGLLVLALLLLGSGVIYADLETKEGHAVERGKVSALIGH